MDKLSIQKLESMGDRFPVEGVCLLQAYTKQPTKNGGSYFGGTLSTSEGTVAFKAWSNSLAYRSLDEDDLRGSIISIRGEINIFNGTKSIILNAFSVESIELLEEMGLSESDFMYSKYNVDAYWLKLDSVLSKNLSKEAFGVWNIIMDKYGDRFKDEFAALYHHDNCRGGLLAHTLKVCQIANIVSLYPNLVNKLGKDLLYLGCALHDIGKVLEYNMGDISNSGRINSHMVLGVVILAEEFKRVITEALGEKFFYDLVSVISSHSGDFGEHPRTVASYIIHMLDNIDSKFAALNDSIEDNTGDVIMFEGYKLS